MEIEIQNLKKSYQNQTVLNIDHCLISHGKITALVGPNGAGKSTFLSLIAGLIEQDSGTIQYDHCSSIPYHHMTLVFQEPYLIHTTVEENIAYPLKIRKKNTLEINERVQQLANELGLIPLLHKKATHLSFGEAQKVALARALSFNPNLLLLDEPSASLDPHTTYDIENMLLKMKNTTIVFITHNLAQAKRMADEIILLHEGKIIEKNDTATFFDHPFQPQTKKFIEGELLI